MKLKVDYIDLSDDSKHSCLIKDEQIKTREDKIRIKQRIERAKGIENVLIVNWKRIGGKYTDDKRET